MVERTRLGVVSGGPSGERTADRLGFLDALRGVAVALVLAQHVGERLFPAFQQFTFGTLQLGQFGVVIFFLCSGFIIPASLERSGTAAGPRAALRMFWISRFFRLYPLYWLSLAGAAVLTAVDVYAPPTPMSSGDWLWGISMLQMLVGHPNALVVYWTLGFEMVFYLSVSTLFALRLHRHSVALALVAAGGCAVLALLVAPALGRAAPIGVFCLATMFTGTVTYRWYRGTVRLRAAAFCSVAALAGGGAVLLGIMRARAESDELDVPSVFAVLMAWLAAYAVFAIGLAARHRVVPGWLRRLGTISYSIYLMQALVLAAVPVLPQPALTAVLWVAGTVGVSELTYRLVERPAVRLGRRLAGHRPAALPVAGTPTQSLADPVAA